MNLMELIDAYAEARHLQGHSSYNAKTMEARKAVVEHIQGTMGMLAEVHMRLFNVEKQLQDQSMYLMRAHRECLDVVAQFLWDNDTEALAMHDEKIASTKRKLEDLRFKLVQIGREG